MVEVCVVCVWCVSFTCVFVCVCVFYCVCLVVFLPFMYGLDRARSRRSVGHPVASLVEDESCPVAVAPSCGAVARVASREVEEAEGKRDGAP